MKKPVVIGNWKTNKTVAESLDYMGILIDECAIDRYDNVDVVLTPTYMGLAPVSEFCEGSRVMIGAQNCDWHKEGSFCGGYTAKLISEYCSFCFAGHSEQRLYYGTTDEQIRLQVEAIIEAGMTPVFCIGETKEAFEGGKTKEYVGRQLEIVLSDIGDIDDMVILYEPVWALGTGIHPVPENIDAAIGWIREITEELVGAGNMENIRFVYAGSINPGNAAQYYALPSVDGLAIGTSALDPYKFADIVKAVSEAAS